RPATALAAMATPILSLSRVTTMRIAASMVRPSRPASAQQPDFRQVLPVDEVVEDEGQEEDRHQDDRPRQLDRGMAAIGGDGRRLVVQREGQRRVALVEPLAPQHGPDRDEHEQDAADRGYD